MAVDSYVKRDIMKRSGSGTAIDKLMEQCSIRETWLTCASRDKAFPHAHKFFLCQNLERAGDHATTSRSPFITSITGHLPAG
jgi:hypothetical protein